MAVNFRVTDLKYYDQLKNGEIFTQNLTEFKENLAGFVQGKKRRIEDVTFWVRYNGDSATIDFTNGKLFSNGVNWYNEGFRVGDEIYLIGNNPATGTPWPPAVTIITSISSDGSIYTDLISGSGNQTFENFTLSVKNFHSALIYSFGLVENQESYSNNNIATDSSQTFYAGDIDANGVQMTPKGTLRDWVTGSASVKFIGSSNAVGYYEHSYQVTHDFIINPWYEDGQVSDLLNPNGIIEPPYLIGDKALKYVNKYEFRRVLSNPNTAKIFTQDEDLGSTAYFNENYNGFNNNYEVIDVEYFGGYDGISPSDTTKVRVTIKKQGGNITLGHVARLQFSKCPTLEEYKGTTATDMAENFIFDSLGVDIVGSGTGTNVIKTIQAVATSVDTFYVEADLSFSQAQQGKIEVNDYYLLSVAVQDNTLPAGDEDGVNLLADVRQFDASPDIDGLATFELDVLPPDHSNGYFTDYYGWNEDGIVSRGKITLNEAKGAVINSAKAMVIAYNTVTGDYFELNSVDFTLNNNYEQDTTQGFPPSIFNSNNWLKALNVGGGVIEFFAGLKINWKDWLLNSAVPLEFYNNTKPNNNQNFKASNYSEVGDWEIRVSYLFNIFGFDDLGRSGNTDYLFNSPKVRVNDYDTPDRVTGVIEVLDAQTGVDLGGSPRTDADSIFRVTYTDNQGAIAQEAGQWFINRIERAGQVGNGIYELGTLTPYTAGLLKPFNGETTARLTYQGGAVIVECLIDYTQLEEGVSYNLTGRASISDGTDFEYKEKTSGDIKQKTDGDNKIKS